MGYRAKIVVLLPRTYVLQANSYIVENNNEEDDEEEDDDEEDGDRKPTKKK